MKELADRKRFVELRANGKSYRRIAEELGISRPTLTRWGEEYKEEIENLQAIDLEVLQDEYRMTKPARIERLGETLTRIYEEIEKRDFSSIPTVKLIELLFKLIPQLAKEIGEPRVYSESELEALYGIRMALKLMQLAPIEPYDPSPDENTHE